MADENEFPELDWPGPSRKPFIIGQSAVGDPNSYVVAEAYAELLSKLREAQQAGLPAHVILHTLQLDLSDREKEAVQVGVCRESYSIRQCAERLHISEAQVKRLQKEYRESARLQLYRETLKT